MHRTNAEGIEQYIKEWNKETNVKVNEVKTTECEHKATTKEKGRVSEHTQRDQSLG
jgi:hypothetical protein